ncbi:hypothetical protein B0H13DRAFT_1864357 [Mycena leptocephala]|nr:hypothetical protein B0H13DRAFT_1864357 [Mycena leptocephala]
MVGMARILVAHDGGTNRAALSTRKRRGKRGTCNWCWDRGFAVARMRGFERGSSIAQLAMDADGADSVWVGDAVRDATLSRETGSVRRRKGGMSGGKGGEEKGAREREETHQKRRLWRHPKSIAETGGASGSLALAKRIDSSDPRTKFCRGQRSRYQYYIKVRRAPAPGYWGSINVEAQQQRGQRQREEV